MHRALLTETRAGLGAAAAFTGLFTVRSPRRRQLALSSVLCYSTITRQCAYQSRAKRGHSARPEWPLNTSRDRPPARTLRRAHMRKLNSTPLQG
jgi:hypothetical protein